MCPSLVHPRGFLLVASCGREGRPGLARRRRGRRWACCAAGSRSYCISAKALSLLRAVSAWRHQGETVTPPQDPSSTCWRMQPGALPARQPCAWPLLPPIKPFGEEDRLPASPPGCRPAVHRFPLLFMVPLPLPPLRSHSWDRMDPEEGQVRKLAA